MKTIACRSLGVDNFSCSWSHLNHDRPLWACLCRAVQLSVITGLPAAGAWREPQGGLPATSGGSVEGPFLSHFSCCKEVKAEGRMTPKELWSWNPYWSWLNIIWFFNLLLQRPSPASMYAMGLGGEREESTRVGCNYFGSYMSSTRFRERGIFIFVIIEPW